MKVAVMGAGGIGGYVGGRLAQVGMEVTLIARGAHLAALQERGLRIETPDGAVDLPDIKAVADPAQAGEADLVVFAVKLADAEAAAAALKPMIGPRTRVLTLQNGIDSKEILERHIGPGRVAAGVIYIAAYIKEPGVIWYPGGIHLTKADAMPGDPVMAELFAASERLQALDILPDPNPARMVWEKFVNLSALAGATSISRSMLGRILETPETRAFFRALLEENYAVARAEGHDLGPERLEQAYEMLSRQPYEMKSSMLVDLEAGKPIEMPWLNGRIVERAARHGIDVPANRAVVAALAPFVNGTPAR